MATGGAHVLEANSSSSSSSSPTTDSPAWSGKGDGRPGGCKSAQRGKQTPGDGAQLHVGDWREVRSSPSSLHLCECSLLSPKHSQNAGLFRATSELLPHTPCGLQSQQPSLRSTGPKGGPEGPHGSPPPTLPTEPAWSCPAQGCSGLPPPQPLLGGGAGSRITRTCPTPTLISPENRGGRGARHSGWVGAPRRKRAGSAGRAVPWQPLRPEQVLAPALPLRGFEVPPGGGHGALTVQRSARGRRRGKPWGVGVAERDRRGAPWHGGPPAVARTPGIPGRPAGGRSAAGRASLQAAARGPSGLAGPARLLRRPRPPEAPPRSDAGTFPGGGGRRAQVLRGSAPSSRRRGGGRRVPSPRPGIATPEPPGRCAASQPVRAEPPDGAEQLERPPGAWLRRHETRALARAGGHPPARSAPRCCPAGMLRCGA